MFWIYNDREGHLFTIKPINSSLVDAKTYADSLAKRAKDRGFNYKYVVRENGIMVYDTSNPQSTSAV
jgi:hypothetical protein